MQPSNQTNGTLLLVMGILSVILCSLLGPVTWVMSNNALAAIDSGRGDFSQRSTINIAKILGIIATVFLILGILFMLFFGAAFFAAIRNNAGMQATPGMPPTMPR